eukprot:scaffold842_cov227-Pinguiococcus_pyrenoidosus.AAC.3
MQARRSATYGRSKGLSTCPTGLRGAAASCLARWTRGAPPREPQLPPAPARRPSPRLWAEAASRGLGLRLKPHPSENHWQDSLASAAGERPGPPPRRPGPAARGAAPSQRPLSKLAKGEFGGRNRSKGGLSPPFL